MLTSALVCATVPTADIERAKRFYAEALGLGEAPIAAHGGVLYAAGRGTMLHVYERPSVAPTQSTVVTFLVPDLEPVMAGLRARGVEFEEYDMPGLKTHHGVYSEPSGSRVSWFKTPMETFSASSSMAICRVCHRHEQTTSLTITDWSAGGRQVPTAP